MRKLAPVKKISPGRYETRDGHYRIMKTRNPLYAHPVWRIVDLKTKKKVKLEMTFTEARAYCAWRRDWEEE